MLLCTGCTAGTWRSACRPDPQEHRQLENGAGAGWPAIGCGSVTYATSGSMHRGQRASTMGCAGESLRPVRGVAR